MTLSPNLSVVEISTLWHFRLRLLMQMFIMIAFPPRLSGIGMPSPTRWSHLLKMQMIVLLSSLLWWELGTNSPITGPSEWLSFRRFTSKLSWSWSWNVASSPRQSGIGMSSPILWFLWSHLLKLQRIVLLNSLLWWELNFTNHRSWWMTGIYDNSPIDNWPTRRFTDIVFFFFFFHRQTTHRHDHWPTRQVTDKIVDNVEKTNRLTRRHSPTVTIPGKWMKIKRSVNRIVS